MTQAMSQAITCSYWRGVGKCYYYPEIIGRSVCVMSSQLSSSDTSAVVYHNELGCKYSHKKIVYPWTGWYS